MGLPSSAMSSPFSFFIVLCFITLRASSSTNTITTTDPLKDPSSLTSNNGVFKLGFITPPGSANRYVGIWYDEVSQDIIWLANTNSPLTDSSGTLQISQDGNLLLLNGENHTIWSSLSSMAESSSAIEARLLDSGNLELVEGDSQTVIWQSFEHPVNSFLPGMKLTFSKSPNSTNLIFLHSWKSNSDPSEGKFSVGFDTFTVPQIVIREEGNDLPVWRSGPWNGNMFIGIEDNINFGGVASSGFILAADRRSTLSLSFTYSDGSSSSFLSNYAINPQGTLILQWWDAGKRSWEVAWQAPQSNCDAYGYCGAFAGCNSHKSRVCQCLKGFNPKNEIEWSKGNWTNGCARRTKLICSGDGFWTLKSVKVPDKADWILGLNNDECRSQCLSNCSCLAYMYDTGAGCLWWSRELIDTVELPGGGGLDLNVRLASLELQQGKGNKVKIIGAIAGILGATILAVCAYLLWRRMYRKQDERTRPQIDFPEGRNEVELEELPLFKLEKLVIATNNFDISNKLGQGGFGPVYKGTLEDGQQIAVKRLSSASGQGMQEFMNEVVVISKLQHRNLVRLLGCCVEAKEKMLIYEYMPNKSLDALLFDPEKRKMLDWKKRFSIIQGICRGLVYLHRDSRLRIIHRDLKASNILLDENLNPKISDFGMAKIFGGNQDQENTKRVVGTYGYMAPEYAMEGKFSEKSDVFSFGVLLLEIVSGRKNNSFSVEDDSLSLLGHAWELWNNNNIVSMIDPMIVNTCFLGEILKCIRVGLLCVQELAKDRPSISKLMYYLGREIADIPSPTAPGFILRQKHRFSGEGSSSQQQQQQSSSCSVYEDDTVLIAR